MNDLTTNIKQLTNNVNHPPLQLYVNSANQSGLVHYLDGSIDFIPKSPAYVIGERVLRPMIDQSYYCVSRLFNIAGYSFRVINDQISSFLPVFPGAMASEISENKDQNSLNEKLNFPIDVAQETFYESCEFEQKSANHVQMAKNTTNNLSTKTIQKAINEAYTLFKDIEEGSNANYIPALAEVDRNIYAIALVTVDGRVFAKGNIVSEVSIQSISKVLTMAMVIEELGPRAILDNIGVDATGQVFNSIVAIEEYKGVEINPMVNPGAIVTTSMVQGSSRDEIWNKILCYYSKFAGRQLSVNHEVFKSESETNKRNQAIAMLMHAYGRIEENPLQATDIYTEQCSVSVNVKDLATMAATLANGGTNPVTGKVVMQSDNVPEVLAVMATSGLYDESGKWLYKTGLPAKSGVGGGIIAVSPGKFGIAVISPPLDASGNSVKGQKTIESVSDALGGNPYAVP